MDLNFRKHNKKLLAHTLFFVTYYDLFRLFLFCHFAYKPKKKTINILDNIFKIIYKVLIKFDRIFLGIIVCIINGDNNKKNI